ncbi:ras-related protein Rab-9B [Toxorhynchites rutilus septentrionalis]|uniref:ras-related protein Rab-9B n=1 Tax=Toxorhynchites rutilus septentrionalis TaxID=329112 RepID=UPI00247A7119|nr:ras-related protein Rab-9B [Toxorhynchites rutilus septentrionalis]
MTNMRPPSKNVLLKVVILGDGGVGKSCLMNRFVSNFFDANSFHTIGVEFLNKDIQVDKERYTLQIWDTAGQERFKALRTPFYRGSDICLLAYAVNDKASFRALIQWREEFLKYYDVKADRFPFIVVGTKTDMSPSQRQVTAEEVSEWCQQHHIAAFIETSAKTSENVYEAFALAVKQWQKLEKSTERELRAQGQDTIDLTKSVHLGPNTSRFCCIGGSNNGMSTQEDDDYPN